MSSPKYRNFGSRQSSPKARFPNLLDNLNKFYELCGENDSEAARRIGVKPQDFSGWRKGEHLPSRLARRGIAVVLGISENDLLYGSVGEGAAHYAKKFSKDAGEIAVRIQRLRDEKDHKLIALLDGLLDFLEEMVEHRQKKIGGRSSPTGGGIETDPRVIEWELKGDE